MNNLHEVKRWIYLLDQQRSQGKWHYFNEDKFGIQGVKYYNTSIESYEWLCNNEDYYPADVSARDSQFIAAAPDMVEVIREQDARIERQEQIIQEQEEELKYIGDCKEKMKDLQDKISEQDELLRQCLSSLKSMYQMTGTEEARKLMERVEVLK